MRLSGGRLSVRLLQCLALGRKQKISREERSFFGTTCPRWESHDRVVAVSPERLSIASKRQTFSKLGVVIHRRRVDMYRPLNTPTLLFRMPTQRFCAGRFGLLRRLFVLQTPVFARDCRSLDTSRSTASASVPKPATTSFKIVLTSSIKNSCL